MSAIEVSPSESSPLCDLYDRGYSLSLDDIMNERSPVVPSWSDDAMAPRCAPRPPREPTPRFQEPVQSFDDPVFVVPVQHADDIPSNDEGVSLRSSFAGYAPFGAPVDFYGTDGEGLSMTEDPAAPIGGPFWEQDDDGATPPPPQPPQRPPPISPAPQAVVVPPPASKPLDDSEFAMDMGLYIFGGILLIVAMEQFIQLGGKLV